jgi:hypothetical protein
MESNLFTFPPRENADWDQPLHLYPALDAPFDDVATLHSQSEDFSQWFISARRANQLNANKRRKQTETMKEQPGARERIPQAISQESS